MVYYNYWEALMLFVGQILKRCDVEVLLLVTQRRFWRSDEWISLSIPIQMLFSASAVVEQIVFNPSRIQKKHLSQARRWLSLLNFRYYCREVCLRFLQLVSERNDFMNWFSFLSLVFIREVLYYFSLANLYLLPLALFFLKSRQEL